MELQLFWLGFQTNQLPVWVFCLTWNCMCGMQNEHCHLEWNKRFKSSSFKLIAYACWFPLTCHRATVGDNPTQFHNENCSRRVVASEYILLVVVIYIYNVVILRRVQLLLLCLCPTYDLIYVSWGLPLLLQLLCNFFFGKLSFFLNYSLLLKPWTFLWGERIEMDLEWSLYFSNFPNEKAFVIQTAAPNTKTLRRIFTSFRGND